MSPHDLELKHFLLEQVPHEFLHVDGKLAKTMRLLLTKPGALARHHVAGRRQPFVSPLRVYVVLFLLQVFVGAATDGPGGRPFLERVQTSDPFGVLSHLMSSRPNVDWNSAKVLARVNEIGHWMSEVATLLIFMFVAAVQQVILYRLHRRYLEHVALALNVASFFLAAITIGELLVWAVARNQFDHVDARLQQILALSALPIYWYLAIRRFYGLGFFPSAAAALVVTSANALMALALTTAVYAILIVAV